MSTSNLPPIIPPVQLKYIRSASGFVIWADMTMTYHAHMARLISEPILSAGFCAVDMDQKLRCYGKSDSLGISSHPSDTEQLNIFLGLQES